MGLKRQRTLLTRPCPRCGHALVDPHTLFRLPIDLELLASAVGLPAETVTQMIASGAIPTRRAVDTLGRRYGPPVVLLAEALAVQGRGTRQGNRMDGKQQDGKALKNNQQKSKAKEESCV
jgi:hypothetical protein